MKEGILFGTLPDGEKVYKYRLESGCSYVDIITYGAAIQSFCVPDAAGNMRDIVLGFDTAEDYVLQDKFIGATAGRFCNRIGGAEFELDGKTYKLAANDGKNHLHGGIKGFDKKNWTVTEAEESEMTLELVSPDGDEGYPGELKVSVTYRLEKAEDSEGVLLTIIDKAVTDAPTLCNLTNHSYFNLNGHDSGTIRKHKIQIEADQYTPTTADSIPDGRIIPVEGTPLDLREPVLIEEGIDSDFNQIKDALGFDRNFVVRGEQGILRRAAAAYAEESGISMKVYTTQPGIQFYSGNFLDGQKPYGKGGAVYEKQTGFCLETQTYPDAVHYDNFPSAVLRPGMEYNEETVYYVSPETEERI